MPDTELRIDGYDEFRAELRKLGPEYSRQLGRFHHEAATPIAEDAADRAKRRRAFGSRAAASIKATRKSKAATIAGGGARFPWFWGAEFGAKRYRQFGPWRGNRWTPVGGSGVGYAMHPAIRDAVLGGEFIETYGDSLMEFASSAFPD